MFTASYVWNVMERDGDTGSVWNRQCVVCVDDVTDGLRAEGFLD